MKVGKGDPNRTFGRWAAAADRGYYRPMQLNSPRYLLSSIPFVAMLAIALGSVVFSCATSPSGGGRAKPFYINVGDDGLGRFHTVQAFAEVDEVTAIDLGDRSRRRVLSPGQWRYDSAAAELVLALPPPYARTVLHVEGTPERPARFVLANLDPGEEPLVAVSGRLAIEGFDYSFDRAASNIVFRDDFDPEAASYLISYRTPFGINSIGESDPKNPDAYAYLEAKHYTDSFAERRRESGEDYFLDPARFVDGKPAVVRRAFTEEERKAAEAPIPVMKSRIKVSDRAISAEVGFDARTPKSISSGTRGKKFEAGGKFIEESAEGGRLRRVVSEFYSPAGAEAGADFLSLRFGPGEISPVAREDERLVIERRNLEVDGISVLYERVWGIRSDPSPEAGPGAAPEPAAIASLSWKEKDLSFEVSSSDELRDWGESLARSLIAYRRGSR